MQRYRFISILPNKNISFFLYLTFIHVYSSISIIFLIL
nr:MAG TPA: hypothetical protein [Caudoviricetes sp.]